MAENQTKEAMLSEHKTIDTAEKTIVFKPKRFYTTVKRVVDILISSVAIILLSPLFAILAILIKIEDGGNVIHKRECIGKKKNYYMLKFRTMVVDADNYEKYFSPEQLEQYKKEIKLDNDPRITKMGRFLRKTSLDELMQLFNIFKGEMSLVGPRPVIKEELEFYGKYRELLLSVPPGLTGYWQTHGRSNSTYESGERQQLELYYVEHRSFALDIKILFKTVKVILKGTGAQ